MPWLYPVVQWSVHWTPSWTTRVLVLAGARLCALETSRGKKKLQTPLLGLAKSIYYFDSLNNITPKQTLEGHEDKGNVHQLKKL